MYSTSPTDTQPVTESLMTRLSVCKVQVSVTKQIQPVTKECTTAGFYLATINKRRFSVFIREADIGAVLTWLGSAFRTTYVGDAFI